MIPTASIYVRNVGLDITETQKILANAVPKTASVVQMLQLVKSVKEAIS